MVWWLLHVSYFAQHKSQNQVQNNFFSAADDKLFAAIALNSFHLLHHLLPPCRRDTNYSLRPRAHDFNLSIRTTVLHSVTIISLTECYIKTLVAYYNIAICVFHFYLTAILCISVLTVTFIELLLTYLLID